MREKQILKKKRTGMNTNSKIDKLNVNKWGSNSV